MARPLGDPLPTRVLLVGGSGLIGAPAARALLAAGHDVTVLTRGQRAVPTGAEALAADRQDPDSLARALSGRRFDMTVDLLGYTAADVLALLDAPAADLGRYVLISTGQVYLVAADPRPPFPASAATLPAMPEPAPDTRAHGNWTYGMGKRAAEATLLGREGAVALRLPIVQGIGDPSRRLWAYLQRLLDGGPVLLPDGGATPVRHVWAEDVARLLVELARGLRTPSPAYNVAMPDEPTLLELLRHAAALLGVDPSFYACTPEQLRGVGLSDALSPYSGPWCSRPEPVLAAKELGFKATLSAGWLPVVVRAHLQEADPEPHESYVGRDAERALAPLLPRLS